METVVKFLALRIKLEYRYIFIFDNCIRTNNDVDGSGGKSLSTKIKIVRQYISPYKGL